MRRLAAAIGVCALLGLTGSAFAAAAPCASVLALESELVCVQCHETLNMSTSPLAEGMKLDIRKFVAAGWCTPRIENYFEVTEHMGPQVLADPPTHGFNLLAWVIPLVIVGVGLLGVCTGAWYWTHIRGDEGDLPGAAAVAGGPPLPPGMDSRIDAELARFDP